jgi:hypothetical protein
MAERRQFPPEARTAPNNARAATALRLAGASFSEIAETLGMAGPETALKLVQQDLATRPDDVADRADLRREEAARLERLLRGVWNKATDPTNPEHIPAARVALAFIDRHARLLGLDAPTEVVVYTPTTTEIDQWVAHIVSMQTEAAFDVEEADVLAIEGP